MYELLVTLGHIWLQWPLPPPLLLHTPIPLTLDLLELLSTLKSTGLVDEVVGVGVSTVFLDVDVLRTFPRVVVLLVGIAVEFGHGPSKPVVFANSR